jgi:type IV secretion system protein VirB9
MNSAGHSKGNFILHALAALTVTGVAADPACAQLGTGAQGQLQGERVDSRIRTIAYSENSIVSLRGHLGYQMLIEFDPAERIENVAIGDSLAWQVTPNRAATMLFLKPVVAGAATNMTVVTTLRRYAFELRALEASGPSDPSIIFALRFSYPDTRAPVVEAPQPVTPQAINLNYTLRGSNRFGAVRVFDDGEMTYFQFPDNVETPAIFVLGESGEEELVALSCS